MKTRFVLAALALLLVLPLATVALADSADRPEEATEATVEATAVQAPVETLVLDETAETAPMSTEPEGGVCYEGSPSEWHIWCDNISCNTTADCWDYCPMATHALCRFGQCLFDY